jgi:hypothetical protein
MEKFLCNTCDTEKIQYRYMQIYSGDWFAYICFDCIKEGLTLSSDEGNIGICFQPKFKIPGFQG